MTRIILFTLLWLFLFFLGVYLWGNYAHAHDGDDAVSKFYRTWRIPDNRASSCCDKTDCYDTVAKYENGEWWAIQRETREWIKIPPSKIEYERDNPDGRSHICATKMGYVFCFIYGGGA